MCVSVWTFTYECIKGDSHANGNMWDGQKRGGGDMLHTHKVDWLHAIKKLSREEEEITLVALT